MLLRFLELRCLSGADELGRSGSFDASAVAAADGIVVGSDDPRTVKMDAA